MAASFDVVIPVYNSLNWISRSVTSLLDTTPVQTLILVDDNSYIETRTYLHDLVQVYPYIKLIQHGTNTRFSEAANDGLALAHTDYVVLMNSDIVVSDNWFEIAVDILDQHPQAAVVGFVQKDESGHLCHSGFTGHAAMHTPQSVPYQVDWVTGSLWLLRRSAWLDVGPLRQDVDTTSGIDYRHFESDREWCFRAKQKGYEIWMSPTEVLHGWRQSTPGTWTHT